MSEYRFVFYPAIGHEERPVYKVDCRTLSEAVAARNAIADYTLFLHKCSLMPDYSNMGWIEVFEDGEWVEVDEQELEVMA